MGGCATKPKWMAPHHRAPEKQPSMQNTASPAAAVVAEEEAKAKAASGKEEWFHDDSKRRSLGILFQENDNEDSGKPSREVDVCIPEKADEVETGMKLMHENTPTVEEHTEDFAEDKTVEVRSLETVMESTQEEVVAEKSSSKTEDKVVEIEIMEKVMAIETTAKTTQVEAAEEDSSEDKAKEVNELVMDNMDKTLQVEQGDSEKPLNEADTNNEKIEVLEKSVQEEKTPSSGQVLPDEKNLALPEESAGDSKTDIDSNAPQSSVVQAEEVKSEAMATEGKEAVKDVEVDEASNVASDVEKKVIVEEPEKEPKKDINADERQPSMEKPSQKEESQAPSA